MDSELIQDLDCRSINKEKPELIYIEQLLKFIKEWAITFIITLILSRSITTPFISSDELFKVLDARHNTLYALEEALELQSTNNFKVGIESLEILMLKANLLTLKSQHLTQKKKTKLKDAMKYVEESFLKRKIDTIDKIPIE